MPTKHERTNTDASVERIDDLEMAALADYKAFVKRAIGAREDLADRMSEARKLTALGGAERLNEKQAEFLRRVISGEITVLIIDAEDAMDELEKLHKGQGKHDDPEHTAEVLRNAARAAALVEDALAQAIELGFDKSPKPEEFDERAAKEKLANIEHGIMDGMDRLKKYKSVHTKIRNNSSFMLYDNEFVDRLDIFDKLIKEAVDLSKKIKTDLKDTSDVILGSGKYDPKELNAKISDIESKYGDIAAKVRSAEENVPAMEKEFEQKKKTYDRFFAMAEKINEMRKSEDIKRVPRGIVVLNGFMPRLRDMRTHNLSEREVDELEKDFEKKVADIIAESKAKEKADREAVIAESKAEQIEAENQKQIAELAKNYLPVLKIERGEIKRMREKIAPIAGFGKFMREHPLAADIAPEKLAQTTSVEKNLHEAETNNARLESILSGKNKMPAAEIRKLLFDYGGEFIASRDGIDQAVDILSGIKKKMIRDVINQIASQRTLKKYLTEREKANMEGVLVGLELMMRQPENLPWEEIGNIKTVLYDNVITPLGEKIAERKRREAAEPSLSPVPPEKSPEELFAEVGSEETKSPEIAVTPEMVASEQPVEEAMPESVEIDVSEFDQSKLAASVENKPVLSKKEVISAISEMYEDEGIINLDARDIMNALSPIDAALFDYVLSDVKNKSESGGEAFRNLLREALKNGLLKSLSAEAREKISEVVINAAYSQLKGAVDTESQAEILRQQKIKLGKLARIGAVGAVGANIVMKVAAGIGLGMAASPVIVATGGLAAPVVGLTMVGVSKGIDSLSKFVSVQTKSFFGKFFNRSKPAIDEAKVIEEKSKSTLTPEMLAAVIANQLREATSEDMRRRMEEFARTKTSAERTLAPGAIDRFNDAVDNSLKDFYKNACNYLAVKYSDLPEETLKVMAMDMAMTIGANQKNEIKTAEAAQKNPAVVRALEKVTKFRSDTVGAFAFGGGMSLVMSVANRPARIVSGALSGAGLGLMIEKRLRNTSDRKIVEKTKNSLSDLENIAGKKGGDILDKDWNVLQTEIANLRKNLADGKFNNDPLTKSRVENLINRVGRMTIERAKEGTKMVDKILADVAKQSAAYDKIAKKHEKGLMKIFGIKDRRTIFALAGAAAGAGLGYYLGAGGMQKMIHDLFGTETPIGKTINFTDRDLQPMHHAPGVSVASPERFALHPTDETTKIAPHAVPHRVHISHPHPAAHIEKAVAPVVEEPVAKAAETVSAPTPAAESAIPESPYDESKQSDFIERELQKTKFTPPAPEHDVARHITGPVHHRRAEDVLEKYLRGTKPAHETAGAVERHPAHAVKSGESIEEKFKAKMGSITEQKTEAAKQWINEPPKSETHATPPVGHAAETVPSVPDADADAGVPDAGAGELSPENQKFVEETQRRVEARHIFEENTLHHAQQLGVEKQYNWLQRRIDELNNEIVDVSADDPNRDARIIELSDNLDRLRDLDSDLKLDILNGDNIVSEDIIRALNREMAAHGI